MSPLVHSPVLMLACPFQTVGLVFVSKKGLSAGNTGTKASFSECTSNSGSADQDLLLLLPECSDLAGSEMSVLVGCCKPLQRCLCMGVKDLGSARAFSRAGRPDIF